MKETRKKYYNSKEIILFLICSVLVVLSRLWNISELKGPFLFYDEAGYWGHAANLMGFPWTETMDVWYSYGYSIILMPLFMLSQDMNVMYRMAIGINAIMGVCSLCLGMAIIKEIDERIPKIHRIMIAFVAACYSSYIYQANIAWSETLLYTWFLFTVWLAIKWCKQPTTPNIIMLSCAIAYLYIIHNRSIVIFVAFGLTVCYMVISKHIRIRDAFIAGIILVLVYGINPAIKEHLQELMWHGKDVLGNNDMASHVGKLDLFFSVSGLKSLCTSLMGKMWYILTATFLLAYFGFAYIVKVFVNAFRNKEESYKKFLALFIGLCCCGTLAVTAIVMIWQGGDYSVLTRLDPYFYGRYSDMISGILIMLGLMNLYSLSHRKTQIVEVIVGGALFFVSAMVLHVQIKDYKNFFLNSNCVPGIYFSDEFSVVWYSLFALIVFGLLIIILRSSINRKARTVIFKAICCGLTVVFVLIGQNAYMLGIRPSQEYYYKYNELYSILNQFDEHDVYLHVTKNDDLLKQAIRTRVVSANILYESPDENDDNYFLVMAHDALDDEYFRQKEHYYIVGVEKMVVFAVGEELVSALQGANCNCISVGTGKMSSLGPENITLNIVTENEKLISKVGEDILLNVKIQGCEPGILINDKDYRLSYHIYNEDGEIFIWDGDRTSVKSVFCNEEEIDVVIDMEQVKEPGRYMIEVDLVEEGVAWFSDLGGFLAQVDIEIR